jgi:hypothetical protein
MLSGYLSRQINPEPQANKIWGYLNNILGMPEFLTRPNSFTFLVYGLVILSYAIFARIYTE